MVCWGQHVASRVENRDDEAERVAWDQPVKKDLECLQK